MLKPLSFAPSPRQASQATRGLPRPSRRTPADGQSGKLTARTLGRLEVSLDVFTLRRPPARGARLLKALLASRNHAVRRAYLAEMLWPDNDRALPNLHAAAHDLHRWFGPANGLRCEGDLYLLRLHEIDVDRFESEILRARAFRRHDPRETAGCYERALSLYEGPFLPDEVDLDSVIQRRLQLEERYMEAAIFLANQALARGDPDDALQLADRVSEVDASREDAVRLSMRALAASGRRVEALRRFERLRITLMRDLDCQPDQATRVIRDEIAGARVIGAPRLVSQG